MEPWLVYAIISIFLAGIYSFLVKVAANKHYNPSMVTGYGYLSGAIFAAIFMIFDGFSLVDFYMITVFAFINVVFYYISTLTRMESMKNIDSVIFFPIFKTVSPILVTIASLVIFSEILSIKEVIGIILGICVPLLLITAHENKRQINLKKGIIYLVISSAFVLVSTIVIKQIKIMDLDVSFFVFMSMILGYFVSILGFKTLQKRQKNKNYITKNILPFGLLMGFFHFSSFYFFTQAMQGNLAIVFTINSFSILIPIILSIIFYKDHFNLKKAFVILLSIVSIILFI